MNAIDVEEPEAGASRPGIPAPEECARRATVRGTPVVLGDGRAWPLAAYVPSFGPAWDRIYDGNMLRGQYDPEDVRLSASALLLENFELPPEAVAALIVGADLAGLVLAVEAALFGPLQEHQTWSDWALGSLYANGIDPATVPPARLLTVLDFLVACRRTVPPGKFISSAVAGAKFAAIRSRIAAQGETKAAEACAPPDPPALSDPTP